MESFVVVRLPSAGTVLGDAIRDHPGARVTTIEASRSGQRVDLLALVEGLPDYAVAQILLAWNLRYGLPADVFGDPFALRLPVNVEALRPPVMAELLRMDRELAVAGNVAQDGWVEQWIGCPTAEAADHLRDEMERRFHGLPGVSVRLGEPRRHDAECWDVLRMAAQAETGVALA